MLETVHWTVSFACGEPHLAIGGDDEIFQSPALKIRARACEP